MRLYESNVNLHDKKYVYKMKRFNSKALCAVRYLLKWFPINIYFFFLSVLSAGLNENIYSDFLTMNVVKCCVSLITLPMI